MSVARLSLSNFRNHADALIVPGARFNILTGENGAGKTNILEALSLLAPGRGLRGARLSAMARQDGPGGFGIAAEVDGEMLGTGANADAPDRRQIRINGAAANAAALAERLSLLWLTPAMDRLFVDTPGARRRFLDRLVLARDAGHAARTARYETAMRSRNALLAGDARPDPLWLDALEAEMAAHGRAIADARAKTIAALGEVLAATGESGFALPLLGMEAGEATDLAAALKDGRRRDAAAGRALAGPHRADLIVTHAAKDQRAALCSTGEQKALLLSIILAHAALVRADTGRPPLLLLDEVAAHLDPARRIDLFARLDRLNAQVWMTGTESSLFAGLGAASHFHITAGRAEPATS